MRRKSILWLVALAMTACGGASGGSWDGGDWEDHIDPNLPPVADISLVQTLDGGYYGWTTWTGDGSDVVVLDRLSDSLTASVIAHELWHVAGFSRHSEDPGCMSFKSGLFGFLPLSRVSPCEAERAVMLDSHWPFTLRPETSIEAETVEAAEWWNGHLGEEIFVVERSGLPLPPQDVPFGVTR